MAPKAADPRHRNANGFTLVELMIVLAVMGLLAGVAVWRWPASGNDARTDAVTLATRIAAVRDQAILGGAPMALVVEPSGYRFEERRGGEWRPSPEPALRERRWRDGVAPELGSGSMRLRFDEVGLPDRSATLRLSAGEGTSEVMVLADGEVQVK